MQARKHTSEESTLALKQMTDVSGLSKKTAVVQFFFEEVSCLVPNSFLNHRGYCSCTCGRVFLILRFSKVI